MKRKRLAIGISITVVILLLLTSFSNVVGYQTVKTTLIDSPLFQTRTQQATSQQQNIITSEYLGKGEMSSVRISRKSDIVEKVQEAICKIKLMDDTTFERYVNAIVYEFSQQGTYDSLELHKIIYELHQIRSTSKTFEGNKEYRDENYTLRATPTFCWFPGCLVIAGIMFTLLFLALMFVFIFFIPPTTFPTCDPYGCPHMYQ